MLRENLSRTDNQSHNLNDNVLDRMSEAAPKLWLPLMLVLCAAYTWRPLGGGDDVWAHGAIGRWIVQNAAVPRESLFIWGATPQPWVYHSWLSQLTFYGLLSPGDETGAMLVLLFTATLVMVVFALLWRLWRASAGGVSAWMPLIFTLALGCSSLRFRPRPEIFTALFLTLLLLFLLRQDAPERQAKRPIQVLWLEAAAIALLFAVWANFHGGVALGLAVLGVTAVLELAQQKLSPGSWKWLMLLAAAVVAVCLTPYGIHYWQALRPVGGEMFERIDEWKPFWVKPVLNSAIVAGVLVLSWVSFLFWAGNPRRRWAQLGWLVLLVVLFLTARRYLWLLPVVALAVMAANSSTLSSLIAGSALLQKWSSPWTRAGSRLLGTAVLVLAILFAVSPARLRSGPLAPATPRSATAYFQQHNLGARGNVFNDYENSSFLQWRFAGEPPLYIDLLNAYPDQLLLDYLRIANAGPRGRQFLYDLNVQTVILRAHKPNSTLAKLAKYLDGDARWQRVYSRTDGTIWLRRAPASGS